MSDQSKTAQFIDLLTGKTTSWATAEDGDPTSFYRRFTELFKRMFDHSPEGKEQLSSALHFHSHESGGDGADGGSNSINVVYLIAAKR